MKKKFKNFTAVIDFGIAFNIIGQTLFIAGFALLTCLVVAKLYDEAFTPFVFSALLVFVIGGLFYFFTRKRRNNTKIYKKEAYLIVTASWLFLSLAGTLPYLFSGAIPGFTNAFFESVSGFTTTGS